MAGLGPCLCAVDGSSPVSCLLPTDVHVLCVLTCSRISCPRALCADVFSYLPSVVESLPFCFLSAGCLHWTEGLGRVILLWKISREFLLISVLAAEKPAVIKVIPLQGLHGLPHPTNSGLSNA